MCAQPSEEPALLPYCLWNQAGQKAKRKTVAIRARKKHSSSPSPAGNTTRLPRVRPPSISGADLDIEVGPQMKDKKCRYEIRRCERRLPNDCTHVARNRSLNAASEVVS